MLINTGVKMVNINRKSNTTELPKPGSEGFAQDTGATVSYIQNVVELGVGALGIKHGQERNH